MKNREAVLNIIRKNKKDIQKYGVLKLGLFGSYARGENSEESDVDLLVEFKTKSFNDYMDLKFFLEDRLECHVDLVLSNTIKPALRGSILGNVIYV